MKKLTATPALSQIVRSPAQVPAPAPPLGPRDLVDAWLRARSPNTIAAYRADLLDFSRFVGASSLDAAAARLLGSGHGHANVLGLKYKDHLIERNLTGATICRRLAALRSLVKLARMLGMVNWALEVENVDSAPYRNTAGPGVEGVQALVDALEIRGGPHKTRNQLAILLMFDLALRRGEVARLNLADLDPKRKCLHVVGKGQREPRKIGLPEPTLDMLLAYLKERGQGPGPLLVSAKGGRLSGKGVGDIVKTAARLARIEARPHGVRHSSITAALDGGVDLRAVARFARHSSPLTTMIYDDRRRDDAREVAAKVAGLLRRPRTNA